MTLDPAFCLNQAMKEFFIPSKKMYNIFNPPQAGLQIFLTPSPLDPPRWIKNDQPLTTKCFNLTRDAGTTPSIPLQTTFQFCFVLSRFT